MPSQSPPTQPPLIRMRNIGRCFGLSAGRSGLSEGCSVSSEGCSNFRVFKRSFSIVGRWFCIVGRLFCVVGRLFCFVERSALLRGRFAQGTIFQSKPLCFHHTLLTIKLSPSTASFSHAESGLSPVSAHGNITLSPSSSSFLFIPCPVLCL